LFIRMKKTLFALFAVSLVLLPVILLASCDFNKISPNTDDRQSMARLSINVGGGTSRALTPELAQSNDGVNYYEVVFRAPNGLYYQVEWLKGNESTAEITIPVGDYTGVAGGTNDAGAVMFAGKKDGNDYTLLAIGVISSVEDYDGISYSKKPDSAEIKTNTRIVTFKLYALENNVNNNNGSAQDPSTFQILAPNSHKTSGGTPPYMPIALESGYPVYSVPNIIYSQDSNEPPDYDKSGSGFITCLYKINCDDPALFSAMKLLREWSVSSPELSDAPYNILTHNGGLRGVKGDPRKPVPNVNTVLDGEFVFHIDLSDASANVDDYCKIYIDVPVHALNATAKLAATGNTDSTIEWHIRGGIDNTVPDGGHVETSPGSGVYNDSTGGAVILHIVAPY